MLEALSATLKPGTLLCVATDLTLPSQSILTMTAAQWRKHRAETDLHKRNTVFLIG